MPYDQQFNVSPISESISEAKKADIKICWKLISICKEYRSYLERLHTQFEPPKQLQELFGFRPDQNSISPDIAADKDKASREIIDQKIEVLGKILAVLQRDFNLADVKSAFEANKKIFEGNPDNYSFLETCGKFLQLESVQSTPEVTPAVRPVAETVPEAKSTSDVRLVAETALAQTISDAPLQVAVSETKLASNVEPLAGKLILEVTSEVRPASEAVPEAFDLSAFQEACDAYLEDLYEQYDTIEEELESIAGVESRAVMVVMNTIVDDINAKIGVVEEIYSHLQKNELNEARIALQKNMPILKPEPNSADSSAQRFYNLAQKFLKVCALFLVYGSFTGASIFWQSSLSEPSAETKKFLKSAQDFTARQNRPAEHIDRSLSVDRSISCKV
jgi:translation elongation factor EF-1beta